MGILYKLRAYLAGNIEYTSGHTDWRQYMTYELEYNLQSIVLSPLNQVFLNQVHESDEDRELLKKWREDGEYDKVSSYMKSVVQKDLRMIDICDFVIIRLEVDKPTFGTIHELIEANNQKKPLFIIVDDKKKIPLWLFGIIKHKYFYTSEDEVLKMLYDIDCGHVKIDSDRWKILLDHYK